MRLVTRLQRAEVAETRAFGERLARAAASRSAIQRRSGVFGRRMKFRRRPVNERPPHVIGPMGDFPTVEQLPPPSTSRWTPRRKAEVVAAVDGGLLVFDETCGRYGLTMEELISWRRAIDRSGMRPQGHPIAAISRVYERRDGY
jgi:hypothetical protein